MRNLFIKTRSVSNIMWKKVTIKQKNISIINLMILILFSFASLDLFQYGGKTFFFYIELIVLIYLVLIKDKGKIHLINDPLIILIFLEFYLSGILAQFGNMNEVYKKTALVMPTLVLPLLLLIGELVNLIHHNKKIIYFFVKGLKIACLIQFIYIPIQYICYHYSGIDINKLVFVDTLKFVQNGSFIRDWVWYPSGITAHSAIVAPLMVLGVVLFRNPYIKCLILIDSLICGSSSAVIGVILSSFFLCLSRLLDKHKITYKRIMSLIFFVFIILIILLFTDSLNVVLDKTEYIISRLFGSSNDSSTNAHILYYYRYPLIFKNNTIVNNLFGYGYGCSGYIFSILDNRINIGNWSVESEVMDRLYSLGIIGFVLYYIFLLNILIKGYRIDKRYTIVMLAIIIQGFGYNLQWDYIFLIELIFYFCIKLKINFFNFIDL